MGVVNRRLRLAKASNAADAFFGQAFGPWIEIVAVALLAASAWQMGLLNALTTVAFMVLGIPIGVFVDRFEAVRVLKLALVAKVALAAVLVAVAVSGHLTIPFLLAFATVMGIVTVATETAQVSTVPALTDHDGQISRTVANIATWDRIASLVAPVAVAYGVTMLGANWTLLAAVGFAVLAMILALFIARPGVMQAVRDGAESGEVDADADADAGAEQTAGQAPVKQSFWEQVKDGWSVLVADRQLAGMTWLSAFTNAGLSMGAAVESILVIQTLDLGVEFYGILGSLAAVSGVAASFVSGRIADAVPVRKLYVWGGMGQGVAASLPLFALLAPQAAVVLLIIHTMAWGIILTITNVASQIYAATTVEQRLLGRISAFRRTLTMGLVPIGSIVGGVLGTVAGLWLPLLLWPVFTLFGVLIYMTLDRRRGPDTA
ncbi:MFS transporter [Pseudoglutamicibacter cumminsii]|uniref:MFS transporter n=1 Tax=Pseudoglutamicibacter cumminsii TaxID=156979 RepID=UPI0019578FC0|nr:MFS transporter [Pseudoglutamicibacter cumminsii]MBM7796126.1 MFS family permease [Pseudoglutamicibacter cumminsii]